MCAERKHGKACASCGGVVHDHHLACPHCGKTLRCFGASHFTVLANTLFIAFNIYMCFQLTFGYLLLLQFNELVSENGRAFLINVGHIGATLILCSWIAGNGLLGALVYLYRKKS